MLTCEFCRKEYTTKNKLDEEENNDKEIEVVHSNFCKIRKFDVNDYAKELSLVV